MSPHFQLKTYVILKHCFPKKKALSIPSMLQGTHNYLGQYYLGKEDRTNIIFKNYFRSIRNIFGKKLAYSVMNRKK